MTFDDKCQVLSDFAMTYVDDSRFSDFFETNDLGVPFAIGVAQNMIAGLAPEGKVWVERAYDNFIEQMQLSDGEYTSLQEIEDVTGLYPIAV